MLLDRYIYNGVQIEVWFNFFHNGYFWVSGTSSERYYGACIYHKSFREAYREAEKTVDENNSLA